jgi:hypothetical protein
MSGDPEQEYFADGMVEDINTALSRFKSLFVIARNSSFAYCCAERAPGGCHWLGLFGRRRTSIRLRCINTVLVARRPDAKSPT